MGFRPAPEHQTTRIRGGKSDRPKEFLSSKTSVPGGPAGLLTTALLYPLSGPVNAVEISKGPATIYGPTHRPWRGSIFSHPIPSGATGHIDSCSYSDHNRLGSPMRGSRAARAFNGFESGAFVRDLSGRTDGFKALDTGDTGVCGCRTYVVKLGASLPNQFLRVEVAKQDENGDETYLESRQADFRCHPAAPAICVCAGIE